MKLISFTAVAALAIGINTAAMAETLRVSTYLPPNHAFNHEITEWGKELSARTNGSLQLELYPAGQLGPAPRQFDLVRAGGADITVVLHAATPGRFPMSELAGLPLTYPSAGRDSKITSRRLTELAPEFLAAEHAGTHILWMAVTPPLKLHFAKTDPSDLNSLKGLRIRYAGSIWQQVIEALGASPAAVQPAETADAMSRGVVDGASFPFEAAMSFDLGPVTRYSLEPGLVSATFAVVISDDAWNRLSEEQRTAITETTGPDRAEAFGKRWDEGEAVGRKYMVDKGVKIVELTSEQLNSLHASFEGIVQRAVAGVSGPGADFVAAYTK